MTRVVVQRVWVSTTALVVVAILGSTVAASTAARPAATRAKRHAPAKLSPVELKQSFDQFCAEWIQKLRDREQHNLAHIEWTPSADGIVGTYVGYSEEHTCTLTDNQPPVGKIRYQQVVYEKKGSTRPSAEDSPPQPVEQYDTTEFFSFIKGKWDY